MHSKLITVTILSLGLATGALAQTSTGSGGSSGSSGSGSLNSTPGAPDTGGDSNGMNNNNRVIDPNATNSTTGGATTDTRTNCAPNLQTQGSATTPDTTGSASVPSGTAGTNTNGQSTNC